MSIESPRSEKDPEHKHLDEKRLLERLGLSETGDDLPIKFEDIDPLAGFLLSVDEKRAWASEREATQKRFLGVRWLARLVDSFRAEPSSLVAGRTNLDISRYEEENPTPLTEQERRDISQIAGLYKDFEPRTTDFYKGIFYDAETSPPEEEVASSVTKP